MINNASSFRVEKINFMELPPYQDQFLRPYSPQMHGNIVEQIYNNMVPGQAITPNTFGRFASTIMTPSASPGSAVIIPNGWATRRFRWVAKIIMVGVQNIPQFHIVTGYCEDFDTGFGGSLNPNMVMNITSSMMFRETAIPDAFGGFTYVLRPSYMTHVMQNLNYGMGAAATTQNLARPEDVIRHIAMNAQLGNQTQYMGQITPVDSLHGSVATKSSYSNAIPSNYLTNIISPVVNAMAYEAMGESTDNMFSRAISNSREQSMFTDTVLTMFMNSRGDDMAGARIMYGDLMRLDPNVDNVTHIQTRAYLVQEKIQQSVAHPLANATGLDANHFQGSTETMRIAAVLNNALPALITEAGLSFMSFRSSNYDAGLTPFKTEVFGVSPLFERASAENLVPSFIHRLETELMMDLSNQNASSLLIWCDVSYTGDCKIMIEWNGQRDQYIAPTFAGNMNTAVVSDNMNMTVHTAQNINNLIQGSFEYHAGNQKQAMTGFTPVASPTGISI